MNKFLRSFVVLSGLLLVFNVFAVTDAKAQNVVNEVLNRMQNHFKALQYVTSNIKMVQTNTQLGVSDTSEGTLKMLPNLKGARYARLDWTKPTTETIVIAKDRYRLYKKSNNQMLCGTTASVQKSEKVPGGSLSFMSMNKTQLKENYDITYIGQEQVTGAVNTWHMKLTPKGKSSQKSADIWVDGDGFIRQAMVTEMNNDTSTIVLTSIEKNVVINLKEFNLEPKGVKCTNA